MVVYIFPASDIKTFRKRVLIKQLSHSVYFKSVSIFSLFITFVCIRYQVLHIDPDKRQVVFGYKLPVSRTASVCWGGPELDELFVTTGRGPSTEKEPLAGALFTIRATGSKGAPVHAFRFDNADSY